VSEITALGTGRAAHRSVAVGARLAALSLASFGVVALVYLVSVQTARGQHVENVLFEQRRKVAFGRPSTALEVLATVSVWSLVAAIGVVVLVALLRGRPRLALGAGVVVATSVVATEVLKKRILARPALDAGAPPELLPNIFPSGHTTVAMAAAVALVLVVPYRLRGVAAVVGGTYAAGVAAATLEAGWHRTSDALGAIFLVGGVALAGCATLVLWRGAGRPDERPALWAWIPLALTAVLSALVVVVGGPRTVRSIDRGALTDVGVRDGFAVTATTVVLAVAVVMVVLLTVLHDVSLDAPQPPAEEAPSGTAASGVAAR
jgi:PAP2 superfamily protein